MLCVKVRRALRSRSPRPPHDPATEPEDAGTVQTSEGRQVHHRSAAEPSSSPLPVGEDTPQRPEGDGVSAQIDSVEPDPEGLSPDDPQPTTTSSAKRTGAAALKLVLEITREVAEASDVLGPLKAATGGVLKVWERYEASDDVKEDFDNTAKKMEAVNDVLKRHGARSDVKGPMQSLADVMLLVQHQIARKDDRSQLRRIVDASDDAKDVASAIRMLGDVADLFVMNVTASMDAKLDTLLENQLLEKLNFVSSALYKAISSSGCLEGTCVQLLAELVYWATTEDDVPPVCFLNGPAGFGKTTVAYTICKILQGLGVLGGSFFCSRDAGIDRRSIRSIFPTLARSLALVSRPYSESLAETLRQDPGASDYEPSEQFKVLFTDAQDWSRSDRSGGNTPPMVFKVFVIDALDECDDSNDATYNMLQILKDEVRGRQLRFLVVSRPEQRILEAFSMDNSAWSSIVRFQDVPEDIGRSDVAKYLRRQLDKCARRHSLSDWPSHDDFYQLELRAGGLFIYAATACKYIDASGGDPEGRLSEVLQLVPSSVDHVDQMYELVLRNALARQSSNEKLITFRFIQTIICLYEPLSMQAISQLIGVKGDKLRRMVSVLHSVVHVPEPGSDEPVTTFHASFADYLLSPERSANQPWHVDSKSAHRDLFASCVLTMKRDLHFNVSQTRTSYARNEDQPDRRPIADDLRYACLMWMDHLEDAAASPADAEQLAMVFPRAFLFWLEVLSVAERTRSGSSMMSRLLNWLGRRVLRHKALVAQDQSTNTRAAFSHKHAVIGVSEGVQVGADSMRIDVNLLMRFARDATVFMTMFAEPIKASAAHIYISALMHVSTACELILPNRALYTNLPALRTKQPRALLRVLMSGHEYGVNSIAFSPDGTHIASGSYDKTIRLWNAKSGATIGDPLQGHESFVWSVAFSPYGTRIASGSDDKTVRLWNAETGAAIGDPLRGHEDSVTSIAFSPDGTRIASASWDKTIRLWDAETGAAVGDPLRGHEDYVISAAFSPDGARIASASCDNTIRLWDAETGAAMSDPLRHHEDTVNSVAFSPDGTRIASGSRDKTIRLWSTETGAAIGDPLRGHEDSVWSVAFSPDGTHIASSSDDKTIRLWDAETGAVIGDPFRGHEDYVVSVTFSPDGTRIASGSVDSTIRLWEAKIGAAMSGPLREHEGEVWSVAFSPDGTRIASGSDDKTIRLWSTKTGAAIGDPLRGHESEVDSVAFSPDGTRIASGSDDKTIRLWHAKSGAAIGDPLQGHEARVWSVAFSPDGTRIVSGSKDGTIRLWDAETGAAIGDPLRGHEDEVNSVAFSPDGTRIASSSDDKTIRLWDAETGVAICNPLRGHEDDVHSVAFSPDGTRIASGSKDGTVRFWDAKTGAAIGDPLQGHEGAVNSVAFSPDGTRIASSSDDKTIRLWGAEDGAAIGDPFQGPDSSFVLFAAFSHDGDSIASGSRDKTIRLWDAETCTVIGDPPRGHGNLHQDVDEANPRYIAFSPEGSHSARLDALIQPGNDKGFAISQYEDEDDGWLYGPQGELFLWLPPEYHRRLCWPRMRAIMGAHLVALDLSRFVHGDAWTKCYSQHVIDDSNDDAEQMK